MDDRQRVRPLAQALKLARGHAEMPRDRVEREHISQGGVAHRGSKTGKKLHLDKQ